MDSEDCLNKKPTEKIYVSYKKKIRNSVHCKIPEKDGKI